MVPSPDVSFWGHMPSWLWPIIIVGMAGFFLNWAIKASEGFARWFGRIGLHVYDRANNPAKVLAKVEHMEETLECAAAYLTCDADWHREADVIIAENCPKVLGLLPHRVPFTEFKRRWKSGWRPDSWDDE